MSAPEIALSSAINFRFCVSGLKRVMARRECAWPPVFVLHLFIGRILGRFSFPYIIFPALFWYFVFIFCLSICFYRFFLSFFFLIVFVNFWFYLYVCLPWFYFIYTLVYRDFIFLYVLLLLLLFLFLFFLYICCNIMEDDFSNYFVLQSLWTKNYELSSLA